MYVEETIFPMGDVAALLKLFGWFAVLSDWNYEYDHLHPSRGTV